jgi:hypothetical protein
VLELSIAQRAALDDLETKTRRPLGDYRPETATRCKKSVIGANFRAGL